MIPAASGAAGQAKDLIEFVGTSTALVTGTFLAFANRAIQDNQARVDRARMVFGLLAALAATGMAGGLVALMLPLGLRSIFVYRGPVEAVLVVYWMLLLSAAGTLAYSLWVVGRCVSQLGRPAR